MSKIYKILFKTYHEYQNILMQYIYLSYIVVGRPMIIENWWLIYHGERPCDNIDKKKKIK